MTLPLLIGYALWFLFIIVWNVSDRRPARTIAVAGARQERTHLLVITAGLVLMSTAPFARMWRNPPFLAWAMLLVVLAGMAICWWARVHLGRLWSAEVTHKEGHHIVDTGPYRLVRHPIYLGFIVIYAGLAVLFASGLGVIAFALFTVGLWLKARLEEAFLAEAFGAAAYDSYKARTPMLIPRLR